MKKVFQVVGEHKKMAMAIGIIAVVGIMVYQYRKATKINKPSPLVGNPDDGAYKS
jgi:hypothetical protein